jgi:hypothetical protein
MNCGLARQDCRVFFDSYFVIYGKAQAATVTLDGRSIVCFSATRLPESARHFYQDVLGLLVGDSRYALVFDANRTMLRIGSAVVKVIELTDDGASLRPHDIP